MNTLNLRRRLTKKTYTTVRLFVRILSLGIIFLVCAAVFLRIYGVPDPVLREIVKRINRAGIPIDVEHVELTLRGWRGFNVRYYSEHPDDLNPVFHAEEVLFTQRNPLDVELEEGLHIDLSASGINLSPSVLWGVDIPDASQLRTVDKAEMSLVFLKDRIESKGSLTWLGARFQVQGTVLKSTRKKIEKILIEDTARVKKQKTVLPVYISKERFRKLEEDLEIVRLNDGADVEIDFFVNAGDFSTSHFDFKISADEVSVRGVEFSKATLAGNYKYPTVRIDELALAQGGPQLRLAGSYELDSKEARVEIRNDITSKQLLALLPQPAKDFLQNFELQFEYLPQFSLHFGPAKPKEFLNSIAGSFSIRSVSYCGLLIDSLSGRITRSRGLLRLTDLRGSVIGQEERADGYGSCMIGGSATGEVFWDAAAEEFGVKASGSLDPNLLVAPLAMVRIATNVIDRFKFEEHPPNVSLELGAKYTDWSTFFIEVKGVGDGVRIHDASLTSIDTIGYYKHGVLRLDPLVAMVGSDFFKGSASIDFLNLKSSFDARSTMSPSVIEDAIYPPLNMFGHKMKTGGATSIAARGVLDWGRMHETDLTAEVEAESLEIPVATVTSFSGSITNVGPMLTVNDASFGFYDGKGTSEFSIQLDPEEDGYPYSMNLGIEGVNFNKYIRDINPEIKEGNSGKLSATVRFTADLSKDFLDSANGSGNLSVVEGQLADLPLFRGFSKIIRKVIPGFKIFSITDLQGSFQLVDGDIIFPDAYFKSDVIFAEANGRYTNTGGFDALVRAHIMNQNPVSKVIQVITSPILKLFEIRLEGTLDNPSWKLKKFNVGKRDGGSAKAKGDSN